jgi:predicted RNA-binding Zn ribbon-like protein
VSFDSHTLQRVSAAADLANAAVAGWARGRPFAAAATSEELLARINGVLAAGGAKPVELSDARGLEQAAGRLYGVFAALDAADLEAAADELNTLIGDHGARPTLIKHDGGPWHLHYHAPDAARVPGIVGGMATGLAILVGTGQAERLGVCSAESCDRVYVDVSRNGTRRFCSTACQNRAKTAAFRARQAAEA